MPLHLLGKKSWNVYNKENIARVRRDEAAAREREEAEEKRRQEIEADRRLAILRGEEVPPLPPTSPRRSASPSADNSLLPPAAAAGADGPRGDGERAPRRKRKRAGEDDTDFEMRLARERAADNDRSASETTALARRSGGGTSSNAPLVDGAGHIDLFPEQRAPSNHGRAKNAEAEREAAKTRREYEDQYTMRFANAAGSKEPLTATAGGGSSGPWYARGGGIEELVDGNVDAPGKDVWGNEDPRRREREAVRMASSDPLAMMKRGAAKAREAGKERRVVNEEKERELRQLRKEERRREKRRRRDRDGDGNDDDLGLDRRSPSRSDRKHRHDHDRDRRRESGEEHHRRHRHPSENEHRHKHRHESSRHSTRREGEVRSR